MMVPWILPESSENEELAKEFCIIAIAIRPGATKLAKGTPNTMRPSRPSATVKMTRNSSVVRSEEHTSELQSLMRISYAVFCLQKKQATLSTTSRQKQTR